MTRQVVWAGPGTLSRTQSVPSQLTSLGTTTARIDRDGTLRSRYNINAPQQPSGTPAEAARSFIAQHSAELLNSGANLIEEFTLTSPGGYHVRLLQSVGGIPVYQGSMTVSMSRAREIRMVVNNVLTGVRLPATTQQLDPEEAIAITRRALNADEDAVGSPDRARLMIFRTPDGTDHLAYRVTATRQMPEGDWEVFVDAGSGTVLSVRDLFVHFGDGIRVQGHGYVYHSDPLSAARQRYGAPGFGDANDARSDSLDFYRAVVELDSLTWAEGSAWLKGPACWITDIESPRDSLYKSDSPDGFYYDRSQPGFEAVNAYYHATNAISRARSLGFPLPSGFVLRIDPHGCNGADDSHYSPTGNWISFGTGGVDDAEDADVIWHEVGHALQYTLTPGWGGGECGALGEGFADYWAASYSRSLEQWQPSDPQYHWLYNWDGHNPFWTGRITNDGRTYPFGGLGIHDAGQIWSSTLLGVMNDLGRDVTAQLILQSMYYLGPGVTATDNAMAILQADKDLFGGRHLPTLLYWLSTLKGFLPKTGDVNILVVNDDVSGMLPRNNEKGISVVLQGDGSVTSASTLVSALGTGAYALQMVSFASLDTTCLKSFDLVVLSAGLNPRPFDDAGRRAAIVRYTLNGGRIAVEGGEVGYYYRKDEDGTDRDPAFRRHVLHVSAFAGDAAEASLLCSRGTLFRTPNVLPEVIGFVTRSTFADRDLMTVDPSEQSTFVLGKWSGYPEAAGIVVHTLPDETINTVYLPFAVASIGDSATAAGFAQNLITFAFSSMTTTGITQGDQPVEFALEQNYPNPFNPDSDIRYQISEFTMVRLAVYDLLGREVAVLVNEQKVAGSYEVKFDGSGLASGVYLCRLAAGTFVQTRKMVLTR